MEGEREEEEGEEEGEGAGAGLRHHLDPAPPPRDQDFPIMHWDQLSQRIAELEQQEQERRERSKRSGGARLEEMEAQFWRNVLEDDGDTRRNRASSRFQSHRNLQLCFVNSGDSDEEEEEEEEGGAQKVATAAGRSALKQEVAAALRRRRDQLLEEQKETQRVPSSSRKHLERLDLEQSSGQELWSLKETLQHDVHALSSELVSHLLVRDQLRTTQDALLLDVQDLS